MAFAQQPSGVLTGDLIPAVTVEVEYTNGEVVTSDSSSVTLTVSDGTLNGTVTEKAVNGVATFSDLSVPTAGICTLTATDGTLTTATSESFGATTRGLAGAWKVTGPDIYGTITTDGHGNVTSGGTLDNNGTSVTIAEGSYALDSQGNVTVQCEDASGSTYTWTGSMNAAHDLIATTSGSGDLNEWVLSTGAPSDADLSGLWSFENSDGIYGTVRFDGQGHITGGSWVSLKDGTRGVVWNGTNGNGYGVNPDGTVDFSLTLFQTDGLGRTVATIGIKSNGVDGRGALNGSGNFVAAGQTIVDISNSQQTTFFVMTKETGTFSLSDLCGAWSINSGGMSGSLTFNGAGKVTGGYYSDENGAFSIMRGTYAIGSSGGVTANLVTDEPGNTTIKLTGCLDSAMDALAMEQKPPGGAGANQNYLSILTNPSATDLVGSVAGGTLLNLNPAIPGDRGSVSVVVTNDGQVPAGASATIGLYLCDSTSETTGGTLLGQLTKQTVNLAYDQSKVYTFSSVQLPANLAYATYYLRADVSATVTNPAENPQSSPAFSAPVQVAWEFGAVGTRKGVILHLTAADGTIATFMLPGAGTGTVTVGGNGWDLDVTGSTTASNLTITTRKSTASSSGQISLDDVTVEGPLASFSGLDVNLTGAMTVSGKLPMLTLNDLSGDGGISIGGAATDHTTLMFNQVKDESLTSGSTIGLLEGRVLGGRGRRWYGHHHRAGPHDRHHPEGRPRGEPGHRRGRDRKPLGHRRLPDRQHQRTDGEVGQGLRRELQRQPDGRGTRGRNYHHRAEGRGRVGRRERDERRRDYRHRCGPEDGPLPGTTERGRTDHGPDHNSHRRHRLDYRRSVERREPQRRVRVIHQHQGTQGRLRRKLDRRADQPDRHGQQRRPFARQRQRRRHGRTVADQHQPQRHLLQGRELGRGSDTGGLRQPGRRRVLWKRRRRHRRHAEKPDHRRV